MSSDGSRLFFPPLLQWAGELLPLVIAQDKLFNVPPLSCSGFWVRYIGEFGVKSVTRWAFELIRFYLQFANPFLYLEMQENWFYFLLNKIETEPQQSQLFLDREFYVASAHTAPKKFSSYLYPNFKNIYSLDCFWNLKYKCWKSHFVEYLFAHLSSSTGYKALQFFVYMSVSFDRPWATWEQLLGHFSIHPSIHMSTHPSLLSIYWAPIMWEVPCLALGIEPWVGDCFPLPFVVSASSTMP